MSLTFPLTEAYKDPKHTLSIFIKANYGSEVIEKYEHFLNQLEMKKTKVSHITPGNKEAIEALSSYIIDINFVIPKFVWHSMKMTFAWSDPLNRREVCKSPNMVFDKINCLWNMAAYLSNAANMLYCSFDENRITEAKNIYSKILGLLNETSAIQQNASQEGNLPGVNSILLCQESLQAYISTVKGLILSCDVKLTKSDRSLNRVKLLSLSASYLSDAVNTFKGNKFKNMDTKFTGSLYAIKEAHTAESYSLLASLLFEKSTSNCGAAIAWLNKALEDQKTVDKSLLGSADSRFAEEATNARSKVATMQKTLNAENSKIYFCSINKVTKTLPVAETEIHADRSLVPISEDLQDPLVDLYPLEVIRGERKFNEIVANLFSEKITAKRDANINEAKNRVILMSLPYCLDGLIEYPESLKNMFVSHNEAKETEKVGVGVAGSFSNLQNGVDRLVTLYNDAKSKLDETKNTIRLITEKDQSMKNLYSNRWNNTNLLRILNTYYSDIANNEQALNSAATNIEQIRSTLEKNSGILQEFENCDGSLVSAPKIPDELQTTLKPLVDQLCELSNALDECLHLESDYKNYASSINIKKELMACSNDTDSVISAQKDKIIVWIRDTAIVKVNNVVLATQKLVRAYELFAKSKSVMDREKDDAFRRKQEIINKGNSIFQVISRDIEAGTSFLSNTNQTLYRLASASNTLRESFEKDAKTAEDRLSQQ